MKLWPWSEIYRLRRELAVAKAQVEACGFAAHGDFWAFVQTGTVLHPSLWTPALAKIMELRRQLDKYPKPPEAQ